MVVDQEDVHGGENASENPPRDKYPTPGAVLGI
jgi:hypothetical protein